MIGGILINNDANLLLFHSIVRTVKELLIDPSKYDFAGCTMHICLKGMGEISLGFF